MTRPVVFTSSVAQRRMAQILDLLRHPRIDPCAQTVHGLANSMCMNERCVHTYVAYLHASPSVPGAITKQIYVSGWCFLPGNIQQQKVYSIGCLPDVPRPPSPSLGKKYNYPRPTAKRKEAFIKKIRSPALAKADEMGLELWELNMLEKNRQIAASFPIVREPLVEALFGPAKKFNPPT